MISHNLMFLNLILMSITQPPKELQHMKFPIHLLGFRINVIATNYFQGEFVLNSSTRMMMSFFSRTMYQKHRNTNFSHVFSYFNPFMLFHFTFIMFITFHIILLSYCTHGTNKGPLPRLAGHNIIKLQKFK